MKNNPINDLKIIQYTSIGQCKNCRWWEEFEYSVQPPEYGDCNNPAIDLDPYFEDEYSIAELVNYTGINFPSDFGCIHWEEKV